MTQDGLEMDPITSGQTVKIRAWVRTRQSGLGTLLNPFQLIQ